MIKIKCEYCSSNISETDEKCPNCGTPKIERIQEQTKNFFYFHGFMVYCELGFLYPVDKWYVFEGDKLVGNFEISKEMQMQYANMFGECVSYEPLVYKLLRLAIGETEVERIEAQNILCPYSFTITRTESYRFQEAREKIKSLLND